SDIYKELNQINDLIKIEKVEQLLENQFSDNKSLIKWNSYCKGLNDYDKYITNLYKYVDIKGVSPKINNTLVKISFENIFVPLELQFEKTSIKSSGESAKKITFTPENALLDFNRLVILGDPGSGKSTILKHLAHEICSKRQLNTQFSDFVPILIKGS